MARYSENAVAAVETAAESHTISSMLDRFDKELELFERIYGRLDGAISSIVIMSESEPAPGDLDIRPTRDSQLYSALEARLNQLQTLRFQIENLIDRIQL